MVSRRQWKALFMVMLTGILPPTLQGKTRRLQVGQAMPAFQTTDDQGQTVTHGSGQDHGTLVVFLSSRQARSDKATAELTKILHELGRPASRLDVFAVVDDPNHFSAWHEHLKGFAGGLHVATDPGKHLWGQFGVIAIPTVIVAGPDDKVLGVAAGYGFDFAPSVRRYLFQALGLAAPDARPAGVATLSNNTVDARVQRLLHTAALLKEKEHFDSALMELRKARELEPDSLPIVLEMVELLCLQGQGEEALAVVAEAPQGGPRDQARLEMMRGWAYRQLGRLDQAEETLQGALKISPRMARCHFQLGRVYEAQGRVDQALRAYRQALILQFGDQ